ncbi:CaiB/BaiF CoA transferase family protein [Halalkalicoccus ordinarius]|uniref:CaiB/BaiF CoA transferase family protein n=1 Tax=Halalkalicoccus ordinarius TaxID=3116651 RepID=UPI00300EDD32
MSAQGERQPLSDITVIELGQIVSGPMATAVLADLGAEVIKVERPGDGDRIRHAGNVGNAMFQSLNRNKRSITINLQADRGQEIYTELVEDADIVIENLRPGAAEHLNVGYASLSAVNPGLIYLSIKGFYDGPYGDRAGMDVVGEAMSGFMQMTGQEGEKPLRAGTSIGDFSCALYGIVGILLALRHRKATGEGQKITAGIFESLSHWMNYWIAYTQFVGADHPPLGASHPSQAVYDAYQFECDRWAFIGIVSEGQWVDLCTILGREDLLANPNYETAALRLEHKEELSKTIASEVRRWDRDELVLQLIDTGIPAAPVNNPSSLVDDPHLEATGLIAKSQTSDGNTEFKSLLTPISTESIRPIHKRAPPRVGEHTEKILRQYGYTRSELDELWESGALGQRKECQ